MLRKSIYAAIVACFCLLLFVGAKASANRSNDPSPIDRLAEMIKAGRMDTDDNSYAEMFYLAGGATSEEAHEKAVEYYKEYDALYVKAIEAGFGADDEEVKSYVESLKEMTKTAANSEDVMKIISAYPSEDDYWKHMLEVYKKQLPVQKYVASLEKSFLEKTGLNRASSEFAEVWHKYPITVESDDWFDHTVLEKTEMLRIDNDKLKKMSNEELVRAVGDFPYLVDIYAYDSLDTGIEMLKRNCDAFSELMLRKDGKAAMKEYGSKIIKEIELYPRKDGRGEFVANALEDIIEALMNL